MPKSTIGTYKKTVWKSLATFIKLREADKFGVVTCVTCPKRMSIYDTECNAGHFVPGRGNSALFDDAHIFPQCNVCNCQGGGEQFKYGIFLKERYGYDDGVLDEILCRRHEVKKYTLTELRNIKKNYDRLSDELRKEKGLKC